MHIIGKIYNGGGGARIALQNSFKSPSHAFLSKQNWGQDAFDSLFKQPQESKKRPHILKELESCDGAIKLNLEDGEAMHMDASNALNASFYKFQQDALMNIEAAAHKLAFAAEEMANLAMGARTYYSAAAQIQQNPPMTGGFRYFMEKARILSENVSLETARMSGGAYFPALLTPHLMHKQVEGGEASATNVLQMLDSALEYVDADQDVPAQISVKLNEAMDGLWDSSHKAALCMTMGKPVRGGFSSQSKQDLDHSKHMMGSFRAQLWNMITTSRLQVASRINFHQFPQPVVAASRLLTLSPAAMANCFRECDGNITKSALWPSLSSAIPGGGQSLCITARTAIRDELEPSLGVLEAQGILKSRDLNAGIERGRQELKNAKNRPGVTFSELLRELDLCEATQGAVDASKPSEREREDFIKANDALYVTPSAPLEVARPMSKGSSTSTAKKGKPAKKFAEIKPTRKAFPGKSVENFSGREQRSLRKVKRDLPAEFFVETNYEDTNDNFLQHVHDGFLPGYEEDDRIKDLISL